MRFLTLPSVYFHLLTQLGSYVWLRLVCVLECDTQSRQFLSSLKEDPATISTHIQHPWLILALCNRCSYMHTQAILVLVFVISSPLLLSLIVLQEVQNNLDLNGLFRSHKSLNTNGVSWLY